MFQADVGHWLKLQWQNKNALNRLAVFLLTIASLWLFAEISEDVMEGDSLAFDRSVLLALRGPGDSMDPRGPLHFMQRDRVVEGELGEPDPEDAADPAEPAARLSATERHHPA